MSYYSRNPRYSNLSCPQCGRRVPLDDNGNLPGSCPLCDEPVRTGWSCCGLRVPPGVVWCPVCFAKRGDPKMIAVPEEEPTPASGRRFFPPGTSPFRPPEAATGRGGEQRFEHGRSFEVRPSGLVVPPEAPGRVRPQWHLPPDSRPFDKSQYTVEIVPRSDPDYWNAALQFVIDNHYARGLPNVQPSDTVVHALVHRSGKLSGVAIYISQPGGHQEKDSLGPSSITSVFPGGIQEALELNRFILLPEVGYNGETWFLDKSRKLLLKQGYRGFTSFSDPHARLSESGEVVKHGHYGTIYKGAGLVYLGQARPESFWFKPDWTLLAYPTGIAKIRSGKVGWSNQVRRLVESGARPPRSLAAGEPDIEELNAWVDRWLPRLARKVRVPGKHKFAFLTDPTKERELRRLGKIAAGNWSPAPVVLPFPSGRDVWPTGKQPSGIARYGEVYPQPPAEPELGRVLEPNPFSCR